MNRNKGTSKKKKQYGYKKRKCFFTENNIIWIDYKDKDLLSRFINKQGKIYPAANTGTKTKHQRKLSTAIKRARHIGILPFTQDPTTVYQKREESK